MSYTVEMMISRMHKFDDIEATNVDEAIRIAEELIEDGETGDVSEVDQISVDAYPNDEQEEVF